MTGGLGHHPRMHASPLATLALITAVCTTACQGACGAKTPATEDAGPPRSTGAITEADTTALDGGLSGEGGRWQLSLPGGSWVEVRAAVRARAKPGVEAWAVEPSTQAQVTVACGARAEDDARDLGATLQARANAARRPLRGLEVEAVPGPWVRGAMARFDTGDGAGALHHAVGVFDLGDATCEVQAWTPAGGDFASLSALISGFSANPSREAVLAARLLERARETPGLEGLAAPAVDGGPAQPRALADAVARGLVRLPDDALEERARLRLALLSRLDDDTCAGLVTQQQALAQGALALLSDEEAQRWVALTEAALSASLDAEAPRPDVADLERRLARDDANFSTALDVLREVDRNQPGDVCRAERTRLEVGLRQPTAQKRALLRAWAGR